MRTVLEPFLLATVVLTICSLTTSAASRPARLLAVCHLDFSVAPSFPHACHHLLRASLFLCLLSTHRALLVGMEGHVCSPLEG